MLMIAVFLLLFVVGIISAFFVTRIKTQRRHTNEKIIWINVNMAWELSKLWRNAHIIWKVIEHLLVIASFSASILTVYIASQSPKTFWIIILLSSISAICTMMQFAFNPVKYINSYRLAFEELNAVLVKNSNSEGDFVGGADGWNEIIQAIIKGEEYIGKTYYVSKTIKWKCGQELEEDETEKMKGQNFDEP